MSHGFVHNVRFEQDGNGWAGSFGIALTAFIEDVLSDGEGFDAQVTYEVDGRMGVVPHVTDDVRVIDVREGQLILAGGEEPIPMEDIRRFDA